MQVYAVYYEASGRFLIGYKLAKGYYFYKSSTRQGSLVPDGQALNGGDNWALPGGKREGQEPIADAALREFMEETAAQIVSVHTDTRQFSEEFSAAFFRIQPAVFNAVAVQIQDEPARGVIGEGCRSSPEDHAIRSNSSEFPKRAMGQRARQCARVGCERPTDWGIIAQWKDDPVIGWYYQILFYLKNSIL